MRVTRVSAYLVARFPRTTNIFGVLQMRMYRLGRLHFEVSASGVQYLNILQAGLSALFILQAGVGWVALPQLELH